MIMMTQTIKTTMMVITMMFHPPGTDHSPEVLSWHGDIVVNVAGHFLILWGYWGCHVVTGIEETVIMRERGGERREGGRE